MKLHALLSTLVFGSVPGCSSSTPPSSPLAGCPHTVIDRQTSITLSDQDACTLALTYTSANKLDDATCRTSCNDLQITDCSIALAYLDMVRELTEGLRPTSVITNLATYFAHCAELETISVESFARLARELRAIGAPERFSLRAEQASLEEIAHTRAMSALTERFGANVPLFVTPALPLRNAFAIAVENAVEGAVRETFGATVALYQAHHATDPEVRRVHLQIADDERSHAELALDLNAYFRTVLGAGECAAIDDAQRVAIAQLRRDVGAASSDARAGLPSSREAVRIIDGLAAALWPKSVAA